MNYPPILILTVGMGFILIKILSVDLERSRQERMLHRLTQKIAMFEGFQRKSKAIKKIALMDQDEKRNDPNHNSDL